MATAVVMPKQGQSVESCVIVGWKRAVGDQVVAGETLAEVETDKALVEVESSASGTLLAVFFQEGDEIPVLTPIAVIGEPGEDVSSLRPAGARDEVGTAPAESEPVAPHKSATSPTKVPGAAPATVLEMQLNAAVGISPRARNLAKQKGLETTTLQGTGPGGRIIERDVQTALEKKPAMTPLARSMVAQGGFSAPAQGSGVRGRIMADDLTTIAVQSEIPSEVTPPAISSIEADVRTIPV